jgi:hypothetical protein
VWASKASMLEPKSNALPPAPTVIAVSASIPDCAIPMLRRIMCRL